MADAIIPNRFPVDCIIKLGGSAITVKKQYETIRSEELQLAASLIQKCVENNIRCVIIHGAGSFGHFQAAQYSLKSGFKHLPDSESRQRKYGFAVTRQSVTKLNKLVVDSLVERNIPAIALSPCGSWRTSGDTVERTGLDAVKDLVTEGFLPVLHGDGCLDSNQGCNILSGDTVILELCKKFDVGRVVFLTDVDGIYDRPPKSEGSRRLPEISIDKNRMIQGDIATDVSGSDVTGGMRLKLETAEKIVIATNGGTPVFVCGLHSPVAEAVCLKGVDYSNGEGTLIRLKGD